MAKCITKPARWYNVISEQDNVVDTARTKEMAMSKAKRMAAKNPYHTFYVARILRVVECR